MTISRRTLLMAAGSLSAISLLPHRALSASDTSFPARPLRMLVGYGPGTAADLIARDVGRQLNVITGQPVAVENLTGGNGLVALHAMAGGDADGYTVYLSAGGTLVTSPLLTPEARDAVDMVSPIGLVTNNPHVMAIYGGLPVNDVGEFIAYAKDNPGLINFASPGTGSVTHLAAELFMSLAGIDARHVPYRDGSSLTTDLVTGRVHAIFQSPSSLLPLIEDGQLRGLGLTAPSRAPALQGLPVLEEAVPGFQYQSWYALFAPAGTPETVIARLNELLNDALSDEELQQRIAISGADIAMTTPAELAARIESDQQLWRGIIESRGITLE